jgi:hypothetical protein
MNLVPKGGGNRFMGAMTYAKSPSSWQISVMPKIDVFNLLNSDDYTAVASTQWAAATYMQPSVILQGRLIRLGVDLKW